MAFTTTSTSNIVTSYQLSPQQERIVEWAKTGEGSLVIFAYAGCTKTTTLMEIAKVAKGQGAVVAFSKAIADEFVARLAAQRSYNMKGSTVHSAGYGAWRRMAPTVEAPDAKKVDKLVKAKFAWDRKLQAVTKDAVGYAKQACLGVEGVAKIDDLAAWQEIIEYYDLHEEIPGGIRMERFIGGCIEVYQESLDMCHKTIDFDDMLLAPLYFKAPVQKYDWVMIDEAQDTSQARRMLVFEMMRPGSRMVAVGDVHQSVFGFAGASCDSMGLIAEVLKARGPYTELPLSVTYRCPKAVVQVAQNWVPDFTANESNPQGLVTHMNHQDFFQQGFQWNDVILCRVKRPLVGIADRLRDQGIPCIVEGLSGKGLRNLAEKWGDGIGLDEYLECLEAYEAAEVAKWEKKGKAEKVEAAQDRCGTMRDMVNGIRRRNGNGMVKDLIRHIEILFGDNSGKVLRLCTIHAAKGREWNRVYLIGRNRYMPSPYAKKDWELVQEENCAYVAVTRAKVELVEVDVPFRDKRKEMEWWEK
jgi:DNA helicase II / ATP-dependent DNA helicase PcrA